MNIQLLLVPYDSGHAVGAAEREHLLRPGSEPLERLGHVVPPSTSWKTIPPNTAEIRTAFDWPGVWRKPCAPRERSATSLWCSAAIVTQPSARSVASVLRVAPLSGSMPRRPHTRETTTTGFLDGMGLATAMGAAGTTSWRRCPAFSRSVPVPFSARGTWILRGGLARRVAGPAVPVEQLPGGLTLLLKSAPIADTVEYLHLDLDVLDRLSDGRTISRSPRALRESIDRRHRRHSGPRPCGRDGGLLLAGGGPRSGLCRAAFAAIEAMWARRLAARAADAQVAKVMIRWRW